MQALEGILLLALTQVSIAEAEAGTAMETFGTKFQHNISSASPGSLASSEANAWLFVAQLLFAHCHTRVWDEKGDNSPSTTNLMMTASEHSPHKDSLFDAIMS